MTWSLERSVGFRVSYLVRRMDTSFGNMMILQTLGSIRLVRDDGTEMDELLRQPKRFALLAYLASPRPGGLASARRAARGVLAQPRHPARAYGTS